MSATTRRRGPYPRNEVHALVSITAASALVVLGFWLGFWLGVLAAAALAAVVVTVASLSTLIRRRILPRHQQIDRAAKYLARPAELSHLRTRGAATVATRLGARTSRPGVHIGRSVRGNRDLWGSWEDMHMDIWGPRTGKTATRAIPAVVSAPGAVVVTSNKRDIVDATRGVREKHGPVWVFDPQGQAGEPPSWWWDPLTFVGDNIAKGLMLASFFSGINRASHARSDGYFEPAGQKLFGAFLLAASIDRKPITTTLKWLSRPTDDTPIRILRAGGHHPAADSVEMVLDAPADQRAGVYGTAAQIASPLASPSAAEWVTPGSNPRRPQFRHADFAERDDGTIYLLSEETDKAAAPLILALVSSLAYAQEGRAISSPGGRLPVPAMYVLDEAANVCPWLELPFLYSHYGSRGIIMMTILQSWAQGVSVWGEAAMEAMWSAANVRVYGGGSADTTFLGMLSQTSPVFEPRTTSLSHSTGSIFDRTVTHGSRPEPVLDIADLANMPRGRALVHVTGTKPTLIRTVPWWQGPHAEAIRASLTKYSPHLEPTPTAA